MTSRLDDPMHGRLAVWVRDVADDEKSRRAVARALREAADAIDERRDTDGFDNA